MDVHDSIYHTSMTWKIEITTINLVNSSLIEMHIQQAPYQSDITKTYV